jgi:hypothetical protein
MRVAFGDMIAPAGAEVGCNVQAAKPSKTQTGIGIEVSL